MAQTLPQTKIYFRISEFYYKTRDEERYVSLLEKKTKSDEIRYF
jgi:hypothetical protein